MMVVSQNRCIAFPYHSSSWCVSIYQIFGKCEGDTMWNLFAEYGSCEDAKKAFDEFIGLNEKPDTYFF